MNPCSKTDTTTKVQSDFMRDTVNSKRPQAWLIRIVKEAIRQGKKFSLENRRLIQTRRIKRDSNLHRRQGRKQRVVVVFLKKNLESHIIKNINTNN